MKIRHAFITAVGGLRAHISRSFLTVLGIVIGITAIVLIMSIGQGAQGLILNQISGFGAENIVVRPGQEPRGPSDVGETILGDSLKERDVIALSKIANVPDAAS